MTEKEEEFKKKEEHRAISQAIRELERQRHEKTRELMAEYDKIHYAKRKEIQEKCGEIGHNWRFSDFGPLGDPWFFCVHCKKTKVELEER